MLNTNGLKGITAAVAMAVVFAVTASASAAPATMPAEKTKLRGAYAIMTKELDLTADQQEKLSALVEKRDAATTEWETANKDKLAAAEKAVADAKAAKDKEATTKAEAALKAIEDGKPKREIDINSVLTAEQQKKWKVWGVWSGALNHYSKAQLTDDQKAKVKVIAADWADKIRVDDKAKAKEATDAFHAEVDKILSAEQLAKMKAPAEKGATTKPAKGM